MAESVDVVLVVDDCAMIRKVMERILTRAGYRVVQAGDGRQALALLESCPVDLVLLDAVMPEMDGLEMLHLLRARTSQLPVIIVSATCGRSEALSAGANDFLPKPYDARTLLSKVAHHLQVSRERAQEDPARPPALGQMVGPYRLEVELGSGAMGRVYRALDTRSQRRVALKVLKADVHESCLERFQQEARAGARVQHPSIARVYEADISPCPFIAMEWVDGVNLDLHLKLNGRHPYRIASLLAQVADILSSIHAAGIVHRDLKPANLMVDNAGRVYLMDFGLAKLLGQDSCITKPGELLGTPAYMAPEQVDSRQFGLPDHLTDIYALGVLLYECLSGRFPYRTRPLGALLRDVLTRVPEPPGSGLAELDALCLRALAKRKEDRFQSAEELRLALEALASGNNWHLLAS